MIKRMTPGLGSRIARGTLCACLICLSSCQRSSEVFERSSLTPKDRAMIEPPQTFGTNYIIKQSAPSAIYQAGGITLTGGFEWVSVHGYNAQAHQLIQELADIQSIEDYLAEASGQTPVIKTHSVVQTTAPITNRPIVTRAELAGIVSAVEPLPATAIIKERTLSDGTIQPVLIPQAQFQREQGVAP